MIREEKSKKGKGGERGREHAYFPEEGRTGPFF